MQMQHATKQNITLEDARTHNTRTTE